MPSSECGPPTPDRSMVPERSANASTSLLSEIEESLKLLMSLAADYDSLHENSSRRIRSHLASTQHPMSDLFNKSAVSQLPLATALLRARRLCEYGIVILDTKPAYGDILYRMGNPSNDSDHWIRETQKESLAFLIPANHPEFPKGRTWRLLERLVLHPDLVTHSRPLVAKKNTDDVENAHYVDHEHHTPGFTDIEMSFHLLRISKEDALVCQGHGIWSVENIHFPLTFPNLEIESLGSEKIRQLQLLLVFVTTREWAAVESLFSIVERIFVGEGFRAIWIDRGESPLLERDIELDGSGLLPVPHRI